MAPYEPFPTPFGTNPIISHLEALESQVRCHIDAPDNPLYEAIALLLMLEIERLKS